MDNYQFEQYKVLLFREMGYLTYAISIDSPEPRIIDAVSAHETMLSCGFSLTPDDVVQLSKYAKSVNEVVALFSDAINSENAFENYLENRKALKNIDDVGKLFRAYEVFYDRKYNTNHEARIPLWADYDISSVSDYKFTNSHLVSLIPLADVFTKPLEIMIERSMILSNKDDKKKIAFTAAQEVPTSFFYDRDIKEKSVLLEAFYGAFCQKDVDKCIAVCKTSSNLFWCLRGSLNRKKWHLSTSEKKICTRLIEELPIEELENYIKLLKVNQDTVIKTLEFFSYNRFSRSPKHKELIFKLRNGEIRTFGGDLDYYISIQSDLAFEILQKNPQLFLKRIRTMLRRGYSRERIKEAFVDVAPEVNVNVMVPVINSLMDDADDDYSLQTISIIKEGIATAIKSIHKEINDKKVYVNTHNVDIAKSIIMKSIDDKEIRSGTVIKLPDNQLVRIYIYWNADMIFDINMDYTLSEDVSPTDVRYSGDFFGEEGKEYIEIETSGKGEIHLSFEIFHGRLFSSINNCEIGGLVVHRETGECRDHLFVHKIGYRAKNVDYGTIKLDENRFYINARPVNDNHLVRDSEAVSPWNNGLSYKECISLICKAHNSVLTEDYDDADVELVIGHINQQSETSPNSMIPKICFFDFFNNNLQ